jgi:hypothetical protein
VINLKIIFKLVISGVIALIVWEIILANTTINTTGYKDHPELGRIYKKGTYIQGTEGYSRSKINSLGMRSNEITKKGKNEIRILALGDSYTEAFQVDESNTYTQILEEELKSKTSKKLNVINAGRSGGSPAHYIHLSNFYNKNINQDYTIIQLNDDDFKVDMLDTTRNFYVIKDENENFITVFNRNFQSANVLLQKFPQFKGLLEFSVLRVGADKAQKLLSSPTEVVSKSSVVTSGDDSDENDLLVKWTVESLKKKYSNVVIVYLPTINYEDIKNSKPTDIEKLLEKYCDLNEVGVINMRQHYIDYYSRFKTPSNGFNNTAPGSGHINKWGHRLVGEQLALYFEGRLDK